MTVNPSYNDSNDSCCDDSLLPSNLPEDCIEEEIEEPICYCYICQYFEPCSFAKRVLREEGYTAETDWRLAED